VVKILIELYLKTTKCYGNAYQVSYKAFTHNAKTPTWSGIVNVLFDDARQKNDISTLVELSAINLLLESTDLNIGCSSNVTIYTQFESIKDALAKSSIKKDGVGKTDKIHVSLYSHPLATKYFHVEIDTYNENCIWEVSESKRVCNYEININQPPLAKIEGSIGELVISRHALNRYVERLIAEDFIKAGVDMTELPTDRWTKAWKSLTKNLIQSPEFAIPDLAQKRINKKFGSVIRALIHKDSKTIFLIKEESYGRVLITIVRNNDFYDIAPEAPRLVGQRLVSSQKEINGRYRSLGGSRS
jgi:hypothetical protein